MLKKVITLSIVTAVLLIGVENSIAQEGTGDPEQGRRRRQDQEGRPGQRGRAQQFREQQEKDSNSQANRTEAMRKRQEAARKITEAMRQKAQQEAKKKIEAMRKKRQQALAQKGTPGSRGRMGRRSQQFYPWRNQPMQRMFGARERGFQSRGNVRRGRRFQCESLCPCCQRSMAGRWRGFQGRGMMGRGGPGFQGRGMMGQGGAGFRGRGMMDRGGPGFQGRGMMGRGPGMPPTPGVKPFPWESPEEDILIPAPPMRGRGMMNRGGPGFRGGGMGWGFRGPGQPDPKPDNN